MSASHKRARPDESFVVEGIRILVLLTLALAMAANCDAGMAAAESVATPDAAASPIAGQAFLTGPPPGKGPVIVRADFHLQDLTVPVHFWQGDSDTFVPLEHGRHQADLVPDSELYIRPTEGHLGSLDAVEEILNAIIDAWDAKVPVSSS